MDATKKVIWEYAAALAVALALAFFIRSTVVEAFEIPSGSMLPALKIGDRVLVDKLTCRWKAPQRFDIIVFNDPQNPGRDLIKRVVALPGEKFEIRARRVFINDAPLDDLFAHHMATDNYRIPLRDDYGPVTIPPGSWFMMGDNREDSHDSRFWGAMQREKIIGRAFIVYWSRNPDRAFPLEIRWNRFGLLLG